MTTREEYLRNEAAKARLRAEVLRAERWELMQQQIKSSDPALRQIQADARSQDNLARDLESEARRGSK